MKAAILVSGWGSPNGIEWKLSPILTELRAHGYETIIAKPTLSGTVDIRRSGKLLARFIRAAALDYDQIDVVGHSLGGLIARYADTYNGNIHAICTLGTPHSGTYLANFAIASTSARQMAVNSEFLKRLDKATHPAAYYCIGAKYDELVFPRSSALMYWAEKNEMVNNIHMGLIYNTKIAKNIVQFFNDGV